MTAREINDLHYSLYLKIVSISIRLKTRAILKEFSIEMYLYPQFFKLSYDIPMLTT